MPNDTSEYRIDASTEKKPVWVYPFWVAPIAGLRRPRTRRVGPLPDFASPGYDCNHHSSLSSRKLAWPDRPNDDVQEEMAGPALPPRSEERRGGQESRSH